MKVFIFIANSRSGHNFVMNQVRSWHPPEMQPKVVNWENMHPKWYQRQRAQWEEAGQLDPDDPTQVVIVMRDLLNWWASYLKFVGHTTNPLNFHNVFDAWEGMMAECAGETRFISDKVTMRYDEFNLNDYIRKAVCSQLGGMYSEERLDEVPKAGGGSSFDKHTLPGRLMGTSKRYKYMLEQPEWWDMLRQRPRAVELYRAHMPQTDEQNEILDML